MHREAFRKRQIGQKMRKRELGRVEMGDNVNRIVREGGREHEIESTCGDLFGDG